MRKSSDDRIRTCYKCSGRCSLIDVGKCRLDWDIGDYLAEDRRYFDEWRKEWKEMFERAHRVRINVMEGE